MEMCAWWVLVGALFVTSMHPSLYVMELNVVGLMLVIRGPIFKKS